MIKHYNDYVQEMVNLMVESGFGEYGRTARKRWYEAFGRYLSEAGLVYSDENVSKWLEEVVKPANTRQQYHVTARYMEQLREFIRTGEIRIENLLLVKPDHDKLPPEIRGTLDEYLASREPDYSPESMRLAKLHTANFLLRLCAEGMMRMETLSYEMLAAVFRSRWNVTPEQRSVILSHGRQLLGFLHEKHGFRRGFSILLEDSVFQYAYVPGLSDDAVMTELLRLSREHSVCTTEEMYPMIARFADGYSDRGYSYTMIKRVTHTLRCLYVFLDMHGLDYCPEVSWEWYTLIGDRIGRNRRAWKRVLALFGSFAADREIRFHKNCGMTSAQEKRMGHYPAWCADAVNGYVDWLARSFHRESTVQNYRYGVWSLCDYLLACGINGFGDITPQMLREYIAQDHHATLKGRSTRITIVNQFLWYVETGILGEEKKLYTVLTAGTAKSVTVPVVLTGDEVKRIYTYRAGCRTGIELRNAAMLMPGLRLGFRASDVVNLKIEDIDWKQRRISIIQEKTKHPLVLPLSIDAGNSLYSYLSSSRPKAENNHVFIRHKAPFGRLTIKSCENAFKAALPEMADRPGVSFHTLRRTFATGILRNNAGMDAVMDALGHHDNSTAVKYLSFDDERMMECPLSLSGIAVEGGAL